MGDDAKMKHINVMLPADEHKAIRQKALNFDVSISETIRLALSDDATWRKAAQAKRKRDA